jgi:acyl-coenzyme A thioesterase PaaI-like protein
MPFAPKDPLFADRVRASFARQRAMHTLGVEITRLAAGEIELAMILHPAAWLRPRRHHGDGAR